MIDQNSKNMTIGLVLTSVPGYSETFFRNKINGLQARGFEVLLFVDSQRNTIDVPCRVVFAPDFGGNSFKLLVNVLITFFKVLFATPKRSFRLYNLDKVDGLSFKRRLKNMFLNQFLLTQDLDWLHFGFGMLANRRENVAMAIGAKMAVSFRGFDLYLSPLKHPGCYDILFKKEVRYHVLSNGMKKRLMGYGIKKQDIHVITPAINIDFFTIEDRMIKKPKNQLQIVTVARLHWIKGLEYTLEALSILKQKGIPFKYIIIGEGEERERLIFAAHQLGILEDMHIVGKLSPQGIKEHLGKADIYLQYSIQEGFCNAALEAQSMGLTSIVSDAEGLKENVLDSITGYVIPKRQPEILAQKIMEVLQMSDFEKIKIQKDAMNRVHREFNLDFQNRAFYNFYQSVD